MANHFSKMRSETSGVVIETAASPMALSHSETQVEQLNWTKREHFSVSH